MCALFLDAVCSLSPVCPSLVWCFILFVRRGAAGATAGSGGGGEAAGCLAPVQTCCSQTGKKKKKKKAGWWGAVRAQSCQACEGALWKVLMWPAFHALSLFDFGTTVFFSCVSHGQDAARLARKETNLQKTQRVRVTVPREVRGGEEVWP